MKTTTQFESLPEMIETTEKMRSLNEPQRNPASLGAGQAGRVVIDNIKQNAYYIK